MRGREPRGVIDAQDYDRFRDEIKARFEATVDPLGKALGTVAFMPEEIYNDVRNAAPDLIIHFGGLSWRSIGGVGYPTIHVQENDTGPDDCNHAQHGAFVLAGLNNRLQGRVEGAHLLDIAPTLLELGGNDVPQAMQGRSLAAGQLVPSENAGSPPFVKEERIRNRSSASGADLLARFSLTRHNRGSMASPAERENTGREGSPDKI